MSKNTYLYQDQDLIHMAQTLLNQTGLATDYIMYLLAPDILNVGQEYDTGIALQSVTTTLPLPHNAVVRVPVSNPNYAEEVSEWQYFETQSTKTNEWALQKVGGLSVLSSQMKMMVMSVISYQIDLELMLMKEMRKLQKS